MHDPEKKPVSFDDPKILNPLAVRSFEDATRRAAAENDALGIPSPVNVDGEIVYALNEHFPECPPKITMNYSVGEKDPGPRGRPWMWIVA